MDHIVRLDLPDPFYRLRALILYTSLYLSLYLSSAQQEALQQLYHSTLESLETEKKKSQDILPSHSSVEIIEKLEARLGKRVSLQSISLTPSKKPCSATPASSTKKKSRKPSSRSSDAPVDITPQNEDLSSVKVCLCTGSAVHPSQEQNGNEGGLAAGGGDGEELDIIWCMGISLLHSEGWSYREIEKFFKGILAAVLSTER
jgi:hypothetical protein